SKELLEKKETTIEPPAIRVEESDLQHIAFAEENGLELTQLRINRLSLLGIFTADRGGFGGSGYAHGTFCWGEYTEKFFDLVSSNRID
ncbi:MAG: hypothetical protein M3Q07_03570, partial [Pseudobdellovibrionaceae bacterium]|nr:hypothetical protein [Pseudobdellovibrionaceae bacterium]